MICSYQISAYILKHRCIFATENNIERLTSLNTGIKLNLICLGFLQKSFAEAVFFGLILIILAEKISFGLMLIILAEAIRSEFIIIIAQGATR